MRKSAVAGQFYPLNAQSLRVMVEGFLQRVAAQPAHEPPLAIMVPHAGYIYSGQTAAYGYKELEGGGWETAILLGPSHFEALDRTSVYARGSWQTPLGELPVDEELGKLLLAANPDMEMIPEAHDREHSLEVQLPFLQVVCPAIKILPIAMGYGRGRSCQAVASVLARYFIPGKHIIIVSTDLSHFHDYDTALNLDKPVLSAVAALDVPRLIKLLNSGAGELCGEEGVLTAVLLMESLGARAQILHYSNSGDSTGDKSRVVGYGAIAFYPGEPKDCIARTDNAQAGPGTPQEQSTAMLSLARRTMESCVTGKASPLTVPDFPLLHEKRGVFVTLHKKAHLRGCIGYVFPTKPLVEAIPEMAIASSTQDMRFPPVTPEELPDIKIEISLLSPLQRVTDPESIIMGVHGVYVKKGFRSGLYLPQVALETGWDRDTFMRHLCAEKAGLPQDAWKDKDTEVYSFSVEHFEED